MPDSGGIPPKAKLTLAIGRALRSRTRTTARKHTDILRNGSGIQRPAPEVLKTDQHSQHPFKLAVEMHLVPAQTL